MIMRAEDWTDRKESQRCAVTHTNTGKQSDRGVFFTLPLFSQRHFLHTDKKLKSASSEEAIVVPIGSYCFNAY